MRKSKVIISDGLTSIFNYINSAEGLVSWSELIQYCIDYDIYSDLYINIVIIDRLYNEHNSKILA